MESVFYNPKKAEKEELIKKASKNEQEKRSSYLKKISNDRNFIKYVVEEIIDAEIKANTDLSGSLESLIGSTEEQLKSILVAKAAGKKTAENIKNKILR